MYRCTLSRAVVGVGRNPDGSLRSARHALIAPWLTVVYAGLGPRCYRVATWPRVSLPTCPPGWPQQRHRARGEGFRGALAPPVPPVGGSPRTPLPPPPGSCGAGRPRREKSVRSASGPPPTGSSGGPKNGKKWPFLAPLRRKVQGEWGGSAHSPDPTAQSVMGYKLRARAQVASAAATVSGPVGTRYGPPISSGQEGVGCAL